MGSAINPIRDLDIKKETLGGWHRGQIEDNNDPAQFGRVRVRVYPFFDSPDIKTDDLPWAEPCWWGPMQIPPKGAWVWVVFLDDDPFKPVYIGIALPKGVHRPLPARTCLRGEAAGELYMDTEVWFKETKSSYPNTIIFRTPNKNMIKIDDDTGEVEIWSHTESHFKIDENGDMWLNGARHIYINPRKGLFMPKAQRWREPFEFWCEGGGEVPIGIGGGSGGNGGSGGSAGGGDDGESEDPGIITDPGGDYSDEETGPNCEPTHACYLKYKDCIDAISEKYNVPRDVIVANIMTESSCNPASYRAEPALPNYSVNGVSYTESSRGLMQVLLSTAYDTLGYDGPVGDDVTKTGGLYDPCTSIDLGTKYLRMHWNKYRNWPDAVAAYNSGKKRKNKQGQYVNSKGDTNVQQHVDRWMRYWAEIKNTNLDDTCGEQENPTKDGEQSTQPVNNAGGILGGVHYRPSTEYTPIF